jgi:hypothetical protein
MLPHRDLKHDNEGYAYSANIRVAIVILSFWDLKLDNSFSGSYPKTVLQWSNIPLWDLKDLL